MFHHEDFLAHGFALRTLLLPIYSSTKSARDQWQPPMLPSRHTWKLSGSTSHDKFANLNSLTWKVACGSCSLVDLKMPTLLIPKIKVLALAWRFCLALLSESPDMLHLLPRTVNIYYRSNRPIAWNKKSLHDRKEADVLVGTRKSHMDTNEHPTFTEQLPTSSCPRCSDRQRAMRSLDAGPPTTEMAAIGISRCSLDVALGLQNGKLHSTVRSWVLDSGVRLSFKLRRHPHICTYIELALSSANRSDFISFPSSTIWLWEMITIAARTVKRTCKPKWKKVLITPPQSQAKRYKMCKQNARKKKDRGPTTPIIFYHPSSERKTQGRGQPSKFLE